MEPVVNYNTDRRNPENYKNIPGWGIDADPENEPTYPMKKYTGDDHNRLNYERAPQQMVDIEILKSIERPSVTRVFGTSTPPQGVSGDIRRFAYRFSESTYAHWVPLVLADRVAVVEGLISDMKKGIFPNLFEEKGWRAEWKYNRKSFVTNIAIGVAFTAAFLLTRSGTKSNRSRLKVSKR